MKTATKNPESEVLIRFPDCDPLKHLNNARYIDYFINTREDHLRDFYDINIYEMGQKTGKMWVVASNQIAYIRPAWFMETVVIESTLIKAEKKRILVEMRMYNQKKTELKAVMWSTFAHFDVKQQKSAEHSEELLDFFKELENPLESTMTFDERVNRLKAATFVLAA